MDGWTAPLITIMSLFRKEEALASLPRPLGARLPTYPTIHRCHAYPTDTPSLLIEWRNSDKWLSSHRFA